MNHFATFALLSIVALSRTFAAPPNPDRPRMWHGAQGTQVEGRVSEVIGPLVLIAGKNSNTLLPLEAMNDEEVASVAAFLANRSKGGATWAASKSKVASAVSGQLVVLQDGKLEKFSPGERPEPDIYLVYFSAAWCAPCQRFTPSLVEAYHEYQRRAPGRIEVIFVSNDNSFPEQLGYIRKAEMPWPVLKYSARGQAKAIERWEGNGIPCLVAVTKGGDVIAHSYRGAEYLGPDHVLRMCDEFLEMLVGTTPAVKRGRHRLEVLEHVRLAGATGSEVKPYFASLDAAKYGGIKIPAISANIQVNEKGRVTEVEFDESVSRDLQRMLRDDLLGWLFLPAVKNGVAVASRIDAPVPVNSRAVTR